MLWPRRRIEDGTVLCTGLTASPDHDLLSNRQFSFNVCFFVYNVYKGVYSVYNGPGGVQKTVQFSVPDSLRLLGHDHFCKYVYFLYNVYKGVYSVYKGPGGVQKTVQFSVPDSLRLLGHDHLVL